MAEVDADRQRGLQRVGNEDSWRRHGRRRGVEGRGWYLLPSRNSHSIALRSHSIRRTTLRLSLLLQPGVVDGPSLLNHPYPPLFCCFGHGYFLLGVVFLHGFDSPGGLRGLILWSECFPE